MTLGYLQRGHAYITTLSCPKLAFRVLPSELKWKYFGLPLTNAGKSVQVVNECT